MTELKWDLSGLFNSNEDFYKTIELTKRDLQDLKERFYDKALDATTLLELLEAKWKLKKKANDVLIYGSLMYYKDVESEEACELKRVAEELNGTLDAELNFVNAKIATLGKETVEAFLKENPALETFRVHLDDIFRKKEHIKEGALTLEIKSNNEAINALLKDYNTLLREIKYGSIEVDGKTVEITATNFAKYISARERETRKQTYFAVNEAFIERAPEFASVLNSIYAYRLQNSNKEGYNSILEKSLFEENIDPAIIDTLLKTVEANLELMRKYLRIKVELLGIEEPHLYDFTVPLDFDAERKFPLEDAIAIIKGALSPLGDEYIATIDELLNGHIDATLDEKKHQSITFSWGTYSFLNYKDGYGDLKNLVHELGHIANYRFSEKVQPFIYTDSTVFVGETASIVNEILLTRYLYSHAETDEERAFYLSKEIENFFTSVFKQSMYTEYENKLYSLKQSRDLDSEILTREYADTVKKYYGSDITYDDVSFLDWTRLGHLYRWSYYPYKYATGLLIASVVVNALEKGTLSVSEYVDFLSSGSCEYPLNLLKILKIDLKDENLLQSGFEILKCDIEQLEKLLDEINKKRNRQITLKKEAQNKEEQ